MKRHNLTPYVRLFLYGHSGAGKTTLCGTAADSDKTGPVLHLNAAGNPVSAAKAGYDHIFDLNKGMSDLWNIHQFLGLIQWLPVVPESYLGLFTISEAGIRIQHSLTRFYGRHRLQQLIFIVSEFSRVN